MLGPILVQACKTGNMPFLERIIRENPADNLKKHINFQDGIGYTGNDK